VSTADTYARAKQKNIAAFIDTRPFTFIGWRLEKVADGAGGFRMQNGDPLETFEGRLVSMASTSHQLNQRLTSDGELVIPQFYIICDPSVPLQRYDQLKSDHWKPGETLEVVFVHDIVNERITAELVER
jgi:hypothetical protein